jgi:hypothetical protein
VPLAAQPSAAGLEVDDLVEVLEEAVSPDDWSLPGRSISGVGTSLVVRAPDDIQARIVNLLSELTMSSGG